MLPVVGAVQEISIEELVIFPSIIPDTGPGAVTTAGGVGAGVGGRPRDFAV